MPRVPDAVQRPFDGAPQSRDPRADEVDPGSAAYHHSALKTRVNALVVLRSIRGTHYALRAISPPSTGMIAPVRNDAAGRHRLNVMWATSSGSP